MATSIIRGTGRRLAIGMAALALAVGGYVSLDGNDQVASGDSDAMAIGIILQNSSTAERGVDTSPLGIVIN
jgi:hypothetical protein